MVKAGLKMAAVVLTAGVVFLAAEGRSEESKPGPAAAGQSSDVADAKPAPINPYNGMQVREEKFEFAQKPTVKKDGNKWVITFGSKANCDATVGILDKDGKIVRHLASGVLGKNAPYPFQQNSLSQKVEWDGQTDDFRKAPDSCKVRVSLGLQAKYERDIAWDPQKGTYIEKDGKYFRTLYPPPADTPEDKLKECGLRPATTAWGDRTFIGNRFGPFKEPNSDTKDADRPQPKCMAILSKEYGEKAPPRKLEFPATKLPSNPRDRGWYDMKPRLAVNPANEELYARGSGADTIYRFDGRTGKLDETWFPNGEFDQVSEIDIGPDGLIYMRSSLQAYGRWLFRVDRNGKPVDFPEGEIIPPGDRQVPRALAKQQIKGVFTGVHGHSNIHQKGFDVSVSGRIVSIISEVDAKWAAGHGLGKDLKVSFDEIPGYYIVVWDNDGKLLTANAVPGMSLGHGVRMDREGNIYFCQYGIVPFGQKTLDGMPGVELKEYGIWGGPGSLLKFRGLGGKYPLGEFYSGKEMPPEATKLGTLPLPGGVGGVTGILWVYPGVINQGRSCSCNHGRYDMDGWARSWIPANQVCSVMVLDGNGNRIARIGKYGNVDDEGIRFAWVRAVVASDSALYAMDYDNRRILKATLSYAAEETILVP